MYNINGGKNQELLNRCSWLKEYMTFVNQVRELHRESGYDHLDDAIERAIDRCIEKNILKSFLTEHRWEVVKAMTLDYTFDRQIMLERQEARSEGHAEGHAKGRAEGLNALISTCKELKVSFDETAAKVKEKFSLEDEEVSKYMQLYW
ncbi:MAG: hypothetical protein K2P59_04095 [Acetatifactor sp.]|nr:hypothetical protein [Acetatifactor sp.]